MPASDRLRLGSDRRRLAIQDPAAQQRCARCSARVRLQSRAGRNSACRPSFEQSRYVIHLPTDSWCPPPQSGLELRRLRLVGLRLQRRSLLAAGGAEASGAGGPRYGNCRCEQDGSQSRAAAQASATDDSSPAGGSVIASSARLLIEACVSPGRSSLTPALGDQLPGCCRAGRSVVSTRAAGGIDGLPRILHDVSAMMMNSRHPEAR